MAQIPRFFGAGLPANGAIFPASSRQRSGRQTVLRRDLSPLFIVTSFLEQPSVFARNAARESLALPSSGAAAIFTRSRPSWMPANSVFDAPGIAFTLRISAPSLVSRKHLFKAAPSPDRGQPFCLAYRPFVTLFVRKRPQNHVGNGGGAEFYGLL